MTHIFGKVFWFFATPSNLLLALAVLAVLLALFTGRRRWAGLALVLLVMLGVAGLSPLPNWVIQRLETRFPVWEQGSGPAPAGILVLGGGADAEASFTRARQIELNQAGDRILEMIALARRFPDAQIIFSGGAGELLGSGVPEADEIARKIEFYGLDPRRIRFENRSRNTWENALFTREMVQPKPDERWLLVTSAFHMPRSMGVFRKAGFVVEAHPVDFRASGPLDAWQPFSSLSRGLARLDIAAKEWFGLLAYRSAGRSAELFPAP